MEIIRTLAERSGVPALYMWALGVLYLTGAVLLGSVAYKFRMYAKMNRQPEQRKNSVVDTMSMTAVLAACFPFMVTSSGRIDSGRETFLFFGLGIFLMLFGTGWHLKAKKDIGRFWSDQIEVQHEHRPVFSGAYALARHPMYGSLVLWGWGAALAFGNLPAFCIVTFVFLPMTAYRAAQEEKVLETVCPDYAFYRRNVGRLLPAFGGTAALAVRVSAIVWFGWEIFAGITPAALFLLVFVHLALGYMLKPDNVAFSYRSKSGMMLVVYAASLLYAPVYHFYWIIWAMFVYSLHGRCPCMRVYDKYHRCPCFALLEKCLLKKDPRK